jgi:hypothetical protein
VRKLSFSTAIRLLRAASSLPFVSISLVSSSLTNDQQSRAASLEERVSLSQPFDYPALRLDGSTELAKVWVRRTQSGAYSASSLDRLSG